MKIGYLLSSSFPYHKLICADAGPSIAEEYGWECCFLSEIDEKRYDLVVVDNRHHEKAELEALQRCIAERPRILFVLRMNDPFVFHAKDLWYQSCFSLLDTPNIHFISPYPPVGLLSILLCQSVRKQLVYAPFTYDLHNELDLVHSCRLRRVSISGNQRKDLYPLRWQVQRASKLKLTSFLLRTQRLCHPGYPEKIHLPSHNIMGLSYVKWLSRCTAAFTDSSIYRIELLKYREIAYAGCAPIGDLPWSLFECPDSAFFHYRSLCDVFRFRSIVSDPQVTQAVASAYRKFIRKLRCRNHWRKRVYEALASLT